MLRNTKTGIDPEISSLFRYFSMTIDISRVKRNFTEPYFDFCRISYDFSKLVKNLAKVLGIPYFIKCKGKKVNSGKSNP